jgi:hypothetical protein
MSRKLLDSVTKEDPELRRKTGPGGIPTSGSAAPGSAACVDLNAGLPARNDPECGSPGLAGSSRSRAIGQRLVPPLGGLWMSHSTPTSDLLPRSVLIPHFV